MNLTATSRRGLTNFDIKVLGITLMFIDHFHEMFAAAGAPNWLDWFGRPVATIFMFLSVEGFTHTHNQRRYLSRLLIGFWVMGIGNLVVQHFFSMGNFGLMNNIFSDLFIGVLTMYGLQTIADGHRDHRLGNILLGIGIIILPLLFAGVLIGFIGTGNPSIFYKAIAIAVPTPITAENSFFLYLGPVMYLLRNKRSWQLLAVAVFAFLSTGFNFSSLLSENTQWMMAFAIIPLVKYNGKLGRSMKGFFYAFYPIHIWVLYIIASLLGVRA